MLHSNEPIIKYKLGLLNLTEELNKVPKACKLMGDLTTLKLRNRQIDHGGGAPILAASGFIPRAFGVRAVMLLI